MAITAKTLLIVMLILGLLGSGVAASQDLSSYESLKTPRLTRLVRQKMIVVEAKGDPNAVG